MPASTQRWGSRDALIHHCPICATALAHPSSKFTCIGRHVQPCWRYHEHLFRIGRASECRTCRASDEQHRLRHQKIAQILYEVSPYDGLELVKSTLENQRKRERVRVHIPDEPDMIARAQSGESSENIVDDEGTKSKVPLKDRKLAQNIERALKARSVKGVSVPAIVWEEVGVLIHMSTSEGDSEYHNHARTLELSQEERFNLKLNASVVRPICQTIRRTVRGTRPDFVERAADVSEELQNFFALAQNTANKATEQAVVESCKLIARDLEEVWKEGIEIMKRKAAYYLYVSTRTYNFMVKTGKIYNWETGERLTETTNVLDEDTDDIDAAVQIEHHLVEPKRGEHSQPAKAQIKHRFFCGNSWSAAGGHESECSSTIDEKILDGSEREGAAYNTKANVSYHTPTQDIGHSVLSPEIDHTNFVFRSNGVKFDEPKETASSKCDSPLQEGYYAPISEFQQSIEHEETETEIEWLSRLDTKTRKEQEHIPKRDVSQRKESNHSKSSRTQSKNHSLAFEEASQSSPQEIPADPPGYANSKDVNIQKLTTIKLAFEKFKSQNLRFRIPIDGLKVECQMNGKRYINSSSPLPRTECPCSSCTAPNRSCLEGSCGNNYFVAGELPPHSHYAEQPKFWAFIPSFPADEKVFGPLPYCCFCDWYNAWVYIGGEPFCIWPEKDFSKHIIIYDEVIHHMVGPLTPQLFAKRGKHRKYGEYMIWLYVYMWLMDEENPPPPQSFRPVWKKYLRTLTTQVRLTLAAALGVDPKSVLVHKKIVELGFEFTEKNIKRRLREFFLFSRTSESTLTKWAITTFLSISDAEVRLSDPSLKRGAVPADGSTAQCQFIYCHRNYYSREEDSNILDQLPLTLQEYERSECLEQKEFGQMCLAGQSSVPKLDQQETSKPHQPVSPKDWVCPKCMDKLNTLVKEL